MFQNYKNPSKHINIPAKQIKHPAYHLFVFAGYWMALGKDVCLKKHNKP
jgi:hypothetical protein